MKPKALAIYKWDRTWQCIRDIEADGILDFKCSYHGNTLFAFTVYGKREKKSLIENRYSNNYFCVSTDIRVRMPYLCVFDDNSFRFMSEDEFYTGDCV